MGQTAADTQREIVALRQEITDAALELDRRVTQLLDVRARLHDAQDWALRMVEEQPQAVAGAGAAVALGVAMLGVRAISERRRKNSPSARLAAAAAASQEEAARRIEEAVHQARALLVANGSKAAALGEYSAYLHSKESEPSMLKKLIWTGLTAGSLALAGILARKFSTSIWQAVMHEDPPTLST